MKNAKISRRSFLLGLAACSAAGVLTDTTGMDLEEARSSITVSTTAYAWENFGLYDTTTRMLVVYEAPDYVKEELQKANVELEQKPIGVDALVFIVNEDNPVQALSREDHQLEGCRRQGSGNRCLPARRGLRQPDPVQKAAHSGRRVDDPTL